MDVKKLFYDVFKSLNPDSYIEYTEDKFSSAMKHYFFVCVVSLFIMFILLVPALIAFPSAWNSAMSHYTKYDVKKDVQLNETFYLMNDPKIRIDTEPTKITDELFIITDQNVYYKSLLFFGSQKTYALSNNEDYLNSDSAVQRFGMLIFFSIPSIFFWSFVIFSIYFWAIIILTCIIGMILSLGLKIGLTNGAVVKSAIYSSTILVTLQIITFPFYRLFFIPLFAYWILFIIVLMSLKNTAGGAVGKKSSGGSSGRSANKSNDSGFIDRDNASSSKKAKRKFEEEAEGYVEWK